MQKLKKLTNYLLPISYVQMVWHDIKAKYPGDNDDKPQTCPDGTVIADSAKCPSSSNNYNNNNPSRDNGNDGSNQDNNNVGSDSNGDSDDQR